MNDRFFDDKSNGIIRKNLLDEEARKEMERFIEFYPDKKNVNTIKSISSTQLRRFFNEFRSLEKKINTDNADAFKKTLPLIKMVKSKVAYSGNKIPHSFRKFLEININAIHDKEDFEAFMLHFEAIVGFCGEHLKN